ncbi:AFR361Cp [Eremothecium gossypii ATCC 10895]|uniref:AFR361Cp n=1 Tax=Eremothecium gossypii (strain ATCC 10895 / CBS 109.51 / FGSC 9923 / NRRL Y-1056) TaxID=284811 RepID=Q753F3_EREGS|nr:AFR361Cp [Eremothecium gossypii ATCC 10895]AAS53732.2 AFR361Cp [Eremothecium gossypii ATCC 10895]
MVKRKQRAPVTRASTTEKRPLNHPDWVLVASEDTMGHISDDDSKASSVNLALIDDSEQDIVSVTDEPKLVEMAAEVGAAAADTIAAAKDSQRSEDSLKPLPHQDCMRKVKSYAQLSSTAHGVRMLCKNISNTRVSIQVESLMIVTKKHDRSLIYLTREMVEWLLVNFPSTDVYVNESLKGSKRFNEKELIKDSKCAKSSIKYWTPELVSERGDLFDMIITLGGDGTVLYVSSIFQQDVPPVMSFALGSLGFLTVFKYENFREDLSKALQSKIRTNMRMRLCCKVYRRLPCSSSKGNKKKYEYVETHHILNELTIDRGPSPFLSMLELYGDHSLLTVAQADGLIIATPTGSTAYSLSAGGSLVYPSVNAICVTPVCPHTLSFRPIILPDSMRLRIKVPKRSRGTAWAAFDGKSRVELQKGDYISVTASPYSFPTLEHSPTDFIDSIRRTLNWNSREPQKSYAHMLSQKNQLRYESDACHKTPTSSDSADDKSASDPEEPAPTEQQPADSGSDSSSNTGRDSLVLRRAPNRRRKGRRPACRRPD